MAEFPANATVPDALPVLSRGRHHGPSEGACFMEYTSVLAGEPFTDHPRCVDEELAALLRGVNDRLTDAERAGLLPLLGRAIGLTAEQPPAGSLWRLPRAERRLRRRQRALHDEEAGLLRRAVARRFMAAIGTSPSSATMVWSGGGERIAWLFWDSMSEPTPVRGSDAHLHRLLDRLRLLHECYESVMDELGLPRDRVDEPSGAVSELARRVGPREFSRTTKAALPERRTAWSERWS